MLFWKAAKAYNEADFEEALGEMENVSPQAVDDFKRCNPKVFCRPFLRTQTKCDVIVSNMVETFNGYVIHARTKHLIMMLEEIRTSLMERVVLKRGTMENNTALICPRIKERLEKEKDEAAKCDPTPSSAFTFQVAYYLDVVSVDLHNRSCTCRRWNLTGIPCRHAIACIFYKHEEAEKYIDMCYGRQAYLDMYSGTINSIPGERYWPKVDMPLDPPPVKVGVGRPRRNRRKTPHEDPKKPGKLTRHGLEMSCSICKSKQHNKRKCPNKVQENEPPPKRGRGRPKKTPSNQSIDLRDAVANECPKHAVVTANGDREHAVAAPSLLGKNGRIVKRGSCSTNSGVGRVGRSEGSERSEQGGRSRRGGRSGRGYGRSSMASELLHQV